MLPNISTEARIKLIRLIVNAHLLSMECSNHSAEVLMKSLRKNAELKIELGTQTS